MPSEIADSIMLGSSTHSVPVYSFTTL
jgi:hypothetical protein